MDNTQAELLTELFGENKKLKTDLFTPNITVAVAIGKNTNDIIHLYTDTRGMMYRITLSEDDEIKECTAFKKLLEHDNAFGQRCTVIPELSDMDSIIKFKAIYSDLEMAHYGAIKHKDIRILRETDLLMAKDLPLTLEHKEFLAAHEFHAFVLVSTDHILDSSVKQLLLHSLNEYSDRDNFQVGCLRIKTRMQDIHTLKDSIKLLEELKTLDPELYDILVTLEYSLIDLLYAENLSREQGIELAKKHMETIFPDEMKKGCGHKFRENAAFNIDRFAQVIFK
ncbi:hypothetical protein ABWJ26_000726 [Vibrio fluvialis]